MRASLHSLEIRNFKTFKGEEIVGPFKPFTAVVGPNGSGKSNLMDAISFVFGEKISQLRVQQAQELINGAHVGRPVSDRASVTAVFQCEDGNRLRFTRTVNKSNQEFYCDQERVSNSAYLGELEKLGICMKDNHSVIYQGTVESIAVLDAKQRTSLFEQISGSKSLKKQYEELKRKLTAAEDMTQLTFEKKRFYKVELKEARSEKGEVEKYDQLMQELDDKVVELKLFKLFYYEKEINTFEKIRLRYQKQLEDLEKSKGETKLKMKHAKNKLEDANRDLEKLEKQLNKHDRDIKKKRLNPDLIKANEEVAHVKKRLETAKKSLKSAKDTHEKHKQNSESLCEELSRVSKQLSEFKNQSLDQSQEIDVQLQGSQVEEYKKRKNKALQLMATTQQQFDSLAQIQQSLMDKLGDKQRKLSDLETQIQLKSQKLDEVKKRSEQLLQKIESSKEDLNQLLSHQESLQSCEEQIKSVQTELNEVSAKLSEMYVSKHQEDTEMKRVRAIEILKKLFPGVYDRLENLCFPIHKKYSIALTKVMGLNLRHIVVDKESTAVLCIKHLKSQMMEPETFLPLDYIKVKPLEEHLRKRIPQKYPFLFQVVDYNIPEIKHVVLFATRSVLVCETAEEAMHIAYNSYPDKQLDAVSLDGTLYRKSGIITGGSVDLARKADHWNKKEQFALKAHKEELSTKLRKLFNSSRTEAGLSSNTLIDGLKARIKVMGRDLKESSSLHDELIKDISILREQLHETKTEEEEVQALIQKKGLEMKEVEEKLHSIEDDMFASFCRKIGVRNIRQYESEGLKSYEQRQDQLMQFINQENRIQNQLEYEKSIDTSENIQRWSVEVKHCKEALKVAENKVELHHQELLAAEAFLEEFRKTVAVRKEEVNSLEKDYDEVRNQLKDVDEQLQNPNKKLITLMSQIEHLRRLCRSLLLECQVENISIPLLQGSVEDILIGANESSKDTTSSTSTAAPSQATISTLEVDYEKLADKLKNFKTTEEIEECETHLKEAVMKLTHLLGSFKAPNKKVDEKLVDTADRLKDTNEEFASIVRKARKAREKFQKIKSERYKAFMDCFDYVSGEIDKIYKLMTKSSSAMALLTAEDPEEPYLSGISYCCIAPGKACKPMHSLSGGEKTIASIALIMALHMYRPTPCLILDEIDAALDNRNIGNVATFLENHKSSFQTIAISHRQEFFSNTDALVGITTDFNEDDRQPPRSKVFMFDLEIYPK